MESKSGHGVRNSFRTEVKLSFHSLQSILSFLVEYELLYNGGGQFFSLRTERKDKRTETESKGF